MAAEVLGYTQVTWDDVTGRELQPPSSNTSWYDLTHKERLAAMVFGHTATSWDNEKEPQPADWDLYWAEMASCGQYSFSWHRPYHSTHPPPLAFFFEVVNR